VIVVRRDIHGLIEMHEQNMTTSPQNRQMRP